jgi:hypothetical protein
VNRQVEGRRERASQLGIDRKIAEQHVRFRRASNLRKKGSAR